MSSDGGAFAAAGDRPADQAAGSAGGLFCRWPLAAAGHAPTLRDALAAHLRAALGYEDLNDHEQLRSDPLLGVLSGKRELDEPLAGKSTLNRLELVGRTGRYHKIGYSTEAIDRLLCDLYIESHRAMPTQIVLDLDATDIPLYGHQPERFFHGYYDSYCYLPLYIFAGDQLLSARLRPANQDAAAGSVEEVRHIVAQLRQRWPEVKIVLRADSGFCREELMGWCEANRVDYLFGLSRNQRLAKIIGAQMHQAHMLHQASGQPVRVFDEFSYRTHKSWSCSRRVVPRLNISTRARTRASWSPRSVPSSGLRRTYTKSSTAPAERWKTASRNRCACSPTGSPPTK